VNKGHIDS